MKTKNEILQVVSEQQIYFNYLGLSDYPSKNISSPFTNDEKPSFRLYKNNTFKCHSSGAQGDVWQFVADLKKIDCKNNFNEVLKVIVDDLSLIKSKPIVRSKKEQKSNLTAIKHKEKFSKNGLNFWMKLGVNELMLEMFEVKEVDFFSFKKTDGTKLEYPLKPEVYAFSYLVGKNYEVYIPQQKRMNKFFYNGLNPSDVFGVKQLPGKCKRIIITAGKKDALTTAARDFNCVSFRSENHNPTQKQIDLLKDKCQELFICYDNDTAGQQAQKKLVEKFGLKPIFLPKNINDLADYFLQFEKEDFEKILSKKQKKEVEESVEVIYNPVGQTIFHVVEDYLNNFYQLRFNTVLLDIEYKKKGSEKWVICNEDSLFIELQKRGINIQMSKLISILKSDFVKKFNPIKSYFEELPKWDGKTDYVAELCKYLTCDEAELLKYHLRKWLARAVKCMLVNGYFNKQALIFTDNGKGQNIGKSHLTKWLCPPNFPVNRSFEDSKKDNLIKLATNSFILLDELDGISKKDINALKALFSMDEIRTRLPYARREETVQRIANFIGSTNEETFLVDPTGSVRWLVFHISKIDWNYSKKINVNNLWAQAYSLAFSENFDETFNTDDVKENEKRNKAFQVMSPEAEIINILFEVPTLDNVHQSKFLTSTEILIQVRVNSALNRLSPVGVGRALKLLKFERVKKSGVYGYYVIHTNRVINEFRQ